MIRKYDPLGNKKGRKSRWKNPKHIPKKKAFKDVMFAKIRRYPSGFRTLDVISEGILIASTPYSAKRPKF